MGYLLLNCKNSFDKNNLQNTNLSILTGQSQIESPATGLSDVHCE